MGDVAAWLGQVGENMVVFHFAFVCDKHLVEILGTNSPGFSIYQLHFLPHCHFHFVQVGL